MKTFFLRLSGLVRLFRRSRPIPPPPIPPDERPPPRCERTYVPVWIGTQYAPFLMERRPRDRRRDIYDED